MTIAALFWAIALAMASGVQENYSIVKCIEIEISVKRKQWCREMDEKVKSPVRDMDKAYEERVVVVEAVVGNGTDEDPVRRAKLYFTQDGDFIGEIS